MAVGVRAPLWGVEGEALRESRWSCGSARQQGKSGRRVACLGVNSAYEWRRACGDLRAEIRELQGAVADAWMQDEMRLLDLQNLASLLVASYAHAPPDRPNEDCVDGAEELRSQSAVIVSELRSEEIRAKQEGLSTLRRLKTLNVHEYVHSALRASHLRSWLKSRGVAESS